MVLFTFLLGCGGLVFSFFPLGGIFFLFSSWLCVQFSFFFSLSGVLFRLVSSFLYLFPSSGVKVSVFLSVWFLDFCFRFSSSCFLYFLPVSSFLDPFFRLV